ncbi:MAG: hypothetical protein IT521_07135 [Burkholderiales bacterium]|nr:hypothetical protein [Burkholderiales bacterium]
MYREPGCGVHRAGLAVLAGGRMLAVIAVAGLAIPLSAVTSSPSTVCRNSMTPQGSQQRPRPGHRPPVVDPDQRQAPQGPQR